MKPIKNKILVKPIKGSNITNGGLLIPDSAMKVSNKVEIVEVGERSKLKKGQIGFRVKDFGTEIMINGEQHFLMDDKAILALA